MTFGFGLGAGLKALTAARSQMQTAGNNIANVNTPGYTRQRVDLVASLPFSLGRGLQMGSGVDVANISRLVDDGLERRIRLQLGMVGSAEVEQARWQELEGIFSEPNGGLSESLGGFFGSIDRLQSDPGDRALRGGVVQSANVMADGLRLMTRRFGDLQESTFTEVRGQLRLVNQRAAAVAQLNAQITAMEANGSSANDLRDQREAHIREIGKLIDTRALERSTGSVDLIVGGHLLVGGDRVADLDVAKSTSGVTQVVVARSRTAVQVNEGRIAGLLRQEQGNIPELRARIDQLAQNLMLETNRLQTTGMPRSGPFQALNAFYGAEDRDGNGVRGNELLGQAGFLTRIEKGDLYVSVTNRTTGAMERRRIAVDPQAMTLQDLANQLNAIDHLTASVDPTGRLRIAADGGYGFDFSPRLDPTPNTRDTFGGQRPSVGTAANGPFDLSGQTFPVTFDVVTGTAGSPTTTTVTINSNDFANVGAVTATELAAAINDDLGTAGTAYEVGGRLLIRSNSGGSTSQLQLANIGAGTILQTLGLSTTASLGQDNGVRVTVEGNYNGTSNGQLVFVPNQDGEIGVTQNLQVSVFDQNGQLVTRLNVGAGYTPGDPIDLGNGVKIGFGSGAVSATAGHAMAFDVLADSDTSDVLVALGLNSFFHGRDASDITVNPDLVANPDLLAAGLSGATGDAANLDRMGALRRSGLADLSDNTLEDFYADMVGELGFSAAGAEQILVGQSELLQHLEQQRESISGVNLDEEMIDMLRFQSAFDAASRFLATVQEMTQTLINLGR